MTTKPKGEKGVIKWQRVYRLAKLKLTNSRQKDKALKRAKTVGKEPESLREKRKESLQEHVCEPKTIDICDCRDCSGVYKPIEKTDDEILNENGMTMLMGGGVAQVITALRAKNAQIKTLSKANKRLGERASGLEKELSSKTDDENPFYLDFKKPTKEITRIVAVALRKKDERITDLETKIGKLIGDSETKQKRIRELEAENKELVERPIYEENVRLQNENMHLKRIHNSAAKINIVGKKED